ncbi:uncharacterized protein P174DRAFT_383269 [Aspergillus novofumigatus IBT 16806]|uniref:Uncharacterized protein n=1 Tax=Aspergillus novofumigatus (strain IBT 16806) TaxID=1392255 RepID=A0A2I1CPF8_ASPN1|nr:uncharacterized protein P174DRAFT_383269 [Aspergillus novofumigatus IBT 16806]PKX99511.1 hypothetical protein P174DRAFT_383269 [Aspergillus novofumigatus IBT 16806]
MAATLTDLTVSDVSGMIAVGIAVVQVLIPVALPVILLGFLKSSQPTFSASTWSALARELHSSYWPTILRTDSSASGGYAVSVVSWSRTGAKILTALAAIVTPLGLYQDIVAQEPISAQFHYLEDRSVFGKNTPPRNADIRFSRICGGFGPMICPGSPGNTTWYKNASGEFVDVDRYDTSIPVHLMESFQSGLSTMKASVSSIFDIQSRYTTTSQTIDISNPLDNGTGYSLSQLRPIQSHITDRSYHLVEGLVIDLQAGGIGFRNHTAPPWRPLGSEWSEDLLFVEPETQCVDVNLTIEYQVAKSREGYTDIVLTDRGGFSNFPTEFSPLNWTTTHSQDDSELLQRAFTAAWVNNFVSMIFMNVTNPRNYNGSGERAFRYLDSHQGKRFSLSRGETGFGTAIISHPSLRSVPYGSYLDGTDMAVDGVNSSNSNIGNFTRYKPALYQNPFHIESFNFTAATDLCSRTTSLDYANISNIHVNCGLVYGVPQRQTPGDPIMFNDPGSNWSIPLYSCAAGVKATIKTVSFRFNGSDDLSGLRVTAIRPKEYIDNSSKPLWGVENSHLLLRDVRPLWGLVSPEAASKLGLSTLRKEHLWLPGTGKSNIFTTSPDYQNLPGVYFYGRALAGAFDVGSNSMGFFDYSGASSISLLLQWQKLSQTFSGTAEALDLIWTDIAANYVLGTRSMATSATGGDGAKRPETSAPDVSVIFYAKSVRLHMLYGIPAFLTLAMILLVCAFALVSIFLQGSGPRRMTKFLNWTSTGRIFTSLNQDSDGSVIYLSPKLSKMWTKEEGRRGITVMDQSESATSESKPEQEAGSTEPAPEQESETPPVQQRLLQDETAP